MHCAGQSGSRHKSKTTLQQTASSTDSPPPPQFVDPPPFPQSVICAASARQKISPKSPQMQKHPLRGAHTHVPLRSCMCARPNASTKRLWALYGEPKVATGQRLGDHLRLNFCQQSKRSRDAQLSIYRSIKRIKEWRMWWMDEDIIQWSLPRMEECMESHGDEIWMLLSAELVQFGERHVPILRLLRKRKNAAQEMTQSCKWMRWWNSSEPLWKTRFVFP